MIKKNYKLNEVKKVKIGDSIISHELAPYLGFAGEKWESVYSGIQDSTLRITYHEYEKPAADLNSKLWNDEDWEIIHGHTRDLRHSLKETNLITFREYELEIIEASPSFIIYRVLKEKSGSRYNPREGLYYLLLIYLLCSSSSF
jgi:hypothetical protein